MTYTTTTFVHVGDIHQRAGRPEIQRALEQILAEGSRVPALGAWLIPGDLFHARSTVEDRNVLDVILSAMASVAPVLLCDGNHDEPGDLDGFARLSGRFPILVRSTPGCVRFRAATGQAVTAFVLPYPNKARLVAAGVATADVVVMGGDLLEPIFMAAAHDLSQARAAGDVTLAIGHINVAGARTSTGQPNIGQEIELSPRHLDRLGPIPTLLNHIHYGQEVHPGTYYAGSITRMNWGEVEPKRALLVTACANPSAPIGVSYHVAEMPIDVPPMYHVEGDLTRDGFTWTLSADQPPPARGAAIDWTGCRVRVRYRFKASESAVLEHGRVAREFPNALEVKVERMAVADRDLRAPEIAAAHTLQDRVRVYLKDACTPGITAKLALLEHRDPTTVLADVDGLIAGLEAPEDVSTAA